MITFRGELDLGCASSILLRGKDAVLASDVGAVVVFDLAEVTFLDSSALGAFIEIRRAADEAGKSIRLINLQASPSRVIEISGLREHLCIEDA